MSIFDNALLFGLVAKEVSKAARAKGKEQRMDHIFNAVEALIVAFRDDAAFMQRIKSLVT
jgi:hypothetical protein